MPGPDPEVDVEPDRKAALRTSALTALRAMSPAARREASQAVVDRLLALRELRHAGTVLLYAAFGDETDIAALTATLHARAIRTVFPRVRGERLELAAVTDLLALRPGYRGIREPDGPAVDPAGIDVVVLPGVAFDPHGGRLGRGGGHYDRLLAVLPDSSMRIGVCFACQIVPVVPRDDHDLPVDVVVTDRAVHRTAARG